MTLEAQERVIKIILWAVKILGIAIVVVFIGVLWVLIAFDTTAGDLVGYLIVATIGGGAIALCIALDAEDTIRHTKIFAEQGREPLFTTKGNFIALGILAGLYMIFLSAFIVGAII